jgi:methionyl-tRNA formyltransferase
MKKMSATIVFFGNERIATGVTTAAPTLQRLISSGYTVAAVVANNNSSSSRKQRTLEVADIAEEHSIPVYLPGQLQEIKDELSSYHAQIGVLIAYGKIVPQEIIDIFPRGIINIHPSLLPLHRGPTPLESTILHGESKTGVSIMQLVKALDAGPLYAQKEVLLNGSESKQLLADSLLEVGGTMLLDLLPRILAGTLNPSPQDETKKATYDRLIDKDDGRIEWQKPAEQIEREIRAYAGWPGSRTAFGSLEVTITAAHSIGADTGKPGERLILDKKPVVACGVHTIAIDRLTPAGKKEMTGTAFLAGYKQIFLAN